ncbi:MAG: LytR/AlgR family response regulator transcription factor, partial [Syntrophothermus sp.]
MRILIIEDEAPAARRLQKMILEIEPETAIAAVLDSVEAAVRWLRGNQTPDLIFMDIQLSDALCFDIFKEVNVESPVIFTTAYDEYAIQAFRVNSIDYLLKPIDPAELVQSLEKFKKIREAYAVNYSAGEISELLKSLNPGQPVYKSRFLIRSGQNMLVIQTGGIACFFVDNKIAYLITMQGKKH